MNRPRPDSLKELWEPSAFERLALAIKWPRKVRVRAMLRAAVHGAIWHAVRLAQRYPEIPSGVATASDLSRYWKDPHDQFILDACWEWISDAGEIALVCTSRHGYTIDDVRGVLDDQLPHLTWTYTDVVTYDVDSPECVGLFAALYLGILQGRRPSDMFTYFLGQYGRSARATQQVMDTFAEVLSPS